MNHKLNLTPINQKNAKEFVKAHHRHHKPPVGSIFQIACKIDDVIVGVIIVGRPVSRLLDDGFTVEVSRCCTNGYKNACSFLYSAAWRAARAMGYRRLITYILSSESGVSLKASNFKYVGKTKGQSWNRPNRPRKDSHSIEAKSRFETIIHGY